MAQETQRAKLEAAGLIEPAWQYSPADIEIIESLSDEEVQALINLAGRVGIDFLHRNSPHGILF
jgi:hypothetical protein